METLYPRQFFNTINTANPYNVVKPNVNYIKIISPQTKQLSALAYNSPTPKPHLINNQNISPFVFEEEKTSINSPMKGLINVNSMQRNPIPRQNIYTAYQNVNITRERNPRVYPKTKPTIPYINNYMNANHQTMNIQRSNTVTMPRPSPITKISPNYYNSSKNNMHPSKKRTTSNNNRNYIIKRSSVPIQNNLNNNFNLKIIPNNQLLNNNNHNNSAIISFDNNFIFPNVAKVTKINTTKASLNMNENLEKTNNDKNIKNNELNKPLIENIAEVTKITNNNELQKNPNNLAPQFGFFETVNEEQQNRLLNNRNQFAYSARFPNTIRQMNNNIDNNQMPNEPLIINTNTYNNINTKQSNQTNLMSKTENKEPEPQIQPTIPFFALNGELISNSNCQEYYRQTNTAPVTSYGYSQNQNAPHRNYMEDEGKVIENFNGDPNKILFCIFDGHGGGQVSKFLQENFGKYMKKIYNYPNIIIGFSAIFKMVDEEIKTLNCPNVGSTGTIVYIEKSNETNKRILYCANVGDSRCVLVNKKGVYRMSYDDRVKDPQENERINKNGGIIVNNRVYGQLMLSRSFGDWKIKDVGVIVDPHITRYELKDEDLFCIIASDGVWDVLKDEECSILEKMKGNTGDMCKNIISECIKRRSFDNLSCFVISLN